MLKKQINLKLNEQEYADLVARAGDTPIYTYIKQQLFEVPEVPVKQVEVPVNGSILQKVMAKLGEEVPVEVPIEEEKTKHDFDNTIEWVEYLDTKGSRTQYGICANCHKKTHAVWGDDEWWCVNCGIGSGELAERMQ